MSGIIQIQHARQDCIPEDIMDTITGIQCANCGAKVDVFSADYVRGYYIGQIDKAFKFDRTAQTQYAKADYKKGYKNAQADD